MKEGAYIVKGFPKGADGNAFVTITPNFPMRDEAENFVTTALFLNPTTARAVAIRLLLEADKAEEISRGLADMADAVKQELAITEVEELPRA